MPSLPFSVGIEGRPRVGLPQLREVNAYIEATPGGPTKAARISRPGLTRRYQLTLPDEGGAPGPILRTYQEPGLFGGDLLTVAGGSLFRNETFVGSLAYGYQPRMAAANSKLAITAGGALYVYDGTALTLVEFFDDGESRLPPFSSVAVLYNIFVYTVAGSTQWFYSNVGEPAVINALSFELAQTSPSPVIEVAVLAEELMFFKTDATEFWDYTLTTTATGQVLSPFKLSQGRTYIRGTAAQGSVVKLDNALFWVGDDLIVYRSGPVPESVTTPMIADRLRNAAPGIAQLTAFACQAEGHWFYVFNLPSTNESYAYDCSTKEWARWGTYQAFFPDPGVFMGSTAAGFGATTFIGSRTDSRIWLLDPANNFDDDVEKQVIVSGAIWTIAGKLRLNNVCLSCVRGVGNADAPDPLVWMRMSKDGARTWSVWLSGTLGRRGEYTYKAVWRGLGLVSQPGVVFEFRVSDPVVFVAEGATYNEARLG